MFDLIKNDLPNFPDEVIKDWLEHHGHKNRWPPDMETASWKGILLKRPLEFWQKVNWVKINLNLSQVELSIDSLNTVGIMYKAYVEGEQNYFLKRMGEKGRQRFINIFCHLLEHGIFPKPITFLKNEEKYEIADGHNRYLAWCMAKDVQKRISHSPSEENNELIDKLKIKWNITEFSLTLDTQIVWVASIPVHLR